LAACSSSRTDASAAGSVIHPAAGKDSVLWKELLQLQEGPLFTSLLKLSPDIFPNSGHMALQFLAFYLPWLRRWWCKVCMEPMHAYHSAQCIYASGNSALLRKFACACTFIRASCACMACMVPSHACDPQMVALTTDDPVSANAEWSAAAEHWHAGRPSCMVHSTILQQGGAPASSRPAG
jgi:hypothetical protein